MMAPAALKTYRLLRTLNLPVTTMRKIKISATGKPLFEALTDDEFDVVLHKIRTVYPQTVNVVSPILQVPTEPTEPREWGVPLHPTTH